MESTSCSSDLTRSKPHRPPEEVIRLFYGFQFFFALLLWVPIFYEFEHRIGLSDPEIFHIQSFYYLAFCFLEVPTGILADWLGRRACMRTGAVMVTVANLVPVGIAVLGWQPFNGFLLHLSLVALARSLISGASSAYLYDYLKDAGASELYRKAEGNARALSLAGKVVLWAGVGAFMEWHLTLPYSLSAAATAVSAFVAWRMPAQIQTQTRTHPNSQASARPVENSGLRILRELPVVLKLLARSPVVILVILQGVAIFVLSRAAQVDLFQPYLKWKGFSAGQFGMIMGLFTVFEALGAARPDWVRRWFGSELVAVFVLTLILSICLVLMAFSGPRGAIAGLCLLSWVTGAAYPIQRQLMNDVIPDSRYRATFLSLESIIDRAGSAASAALMGGFVAGGQVGAFLQYAALISLITMGILIFLARIWAPQWMMGRVGNAGTG